MNPLSYLKQLEKNGFEAYIIGGYVRDLILNINNKDIDITTNATPNDIKKIFGLDVKDKYGSITFTVDDYTIDMTTFRRESNYIGHKPQNIEFSSNLKDDLARRDFTVNTICMKSDGSFIDIYNGIEDLKNGIIRVVGNIEEKISEDPLRILRAYRLMINYGFNLETNLNEYLSGHMDLLKSISFDRYKSELNKIFTNPKSFVRMDYLKIHNLYRYLEIDFNNIMYTQDILGIWSQLDYSDKYIFSKNDTKRICNIKNIVKSKQIDNFTIYNYGLYDSIVAGEILGIDESEIKMIYELMPIRSTKDIDIDWISIFKNLMSTEIINQIKEDLVLNILNNKLDNNRKEIEDYIYKKWK